MKRSRRVRLVIEQISKGHLEWARFLRVSSGLAIIIDRQDCWHARIHSDINPFAHGPSRSGLPFSIGLWLADGPKVLSAEFSRDELCVNNMRHGDWEVDFFGLPEFEGQSYLAPYELRKMCARRWVAGSPARPRGRRLSERPGLKLVE